MDDLSIERWDQLLPELRLRLDVLRHCPPVTDLKSVPKEPGVYLFTEQGQHLYVSRTSELRSRIRGHSKLSAEPHQAHFAVHLARKSYRLMHGSLPQKDSIEFRQHFNAAKQRITQTSRAGRTCPRQLVLHHRGAGAGAESELLVRPGDQGAVEHDEAERRRVRSR